MSPLWLSLLVVLPVLDSAYRAVLLVASRRWPRLPRGEPRRGYLVLIPARAEGEAVLPTLRSVLAGGVAGEVQPLLLLDGEDPAAEVAATALGVRTACKLPAGPSKAAVLAWAVERFAEEVAAANAVLVLDVGSTVSEHFFERLRWPPGADGVQAFLSGAGTGPGAGAALSERLAQRHEDCGREVLGLSVRLRGTGFALRPGLFRATVGRLRTQVEDTEMSLLLDAVGARLALGGTEATVFDVKPERVADAARQRARWLAGQLALPVRQLGALLRLVARRPLAGLGFLGEVGGRPLSLTVPLRLLVAVVMILAAGVTSGVEMAVAAVAVLSALFDLVVHVVAGGFGLGSALALAGSWVRAVLLLPWALVGWMRVRR